MSRIFSKGATGNINARPVFPISSVGIEERMDLCYQAAARAIIAAGSLVFLPVAAC